MRIGIVSTWFERGAAYVSRQYRDAFSVENEVYIYARGGESFARGDSAWDSERVTWGKKTGFPHPMAINLRDFRRWIEKYQLEVIFFNEQQCWNPILLCNELGVLTGAYVDYYTEDTVKLFACYDFLICNTKRHLSVFNWHPHCYFVPWGTDLTKFQKNSFELVEEGVITFFHSCGVSPMRKGCDRVIQSFSKLEGNAKLVIHSQNNLKRELPELADLIASLENSKSLKIYEGTVGAPGLYRKGDIYVYPSRLEGIGLTIAEALACGMPVITSNNPPMSEFVIDGVNGKLVDIEGYVARGDGYYWPQCNVNEDDLLDKMQFYVDHISQAPNFKYDARLSAELGLNWKNSYQSINSILKKIPSKPNKKPTGLINAARDFEKNRRFLRFSKIMLPYWWLKNILVK